MYRKNLETILILDKSAKYYTINILILKLFSSYYIIIVVRCISIIRHTVYIFFVIIINDMK